ncbi:MAG: RcnB family protein [Pseudomonadota bacterium]
MRMTFALAALFAATAITPALAQDHGRGDRGDRGGGRSEQRADGGQRQDRGDRGQGGGWQRGQQAAPAPAAQPQPQPQPQVQQQAQQRWNGNRGNGDGGMNAQRNWNRGQQDGGQRNWRRNDAPQSQLGGTAVAPPVVINRDANQDGRRWDGNRQDRGGWNGTFGRNGQAWQQNQNQNRNDNWRNNNQGRNDAWRNQQGRNDNRWNGNNNYRPDRNWNGNRAWTRDWRNNNQYDWQRYRYSNRDLFRARPYYAPRGWGYGYQRFSIGYTLSSILFDQQYWIDDPYDYRLPPAYGPYRWVRYYDDVLLVDIRTGQVVDVINDFFW